jgi:hypothetical protein
MDVDGENKSATLRVPRGLPKAHSCAKDGGDRAVLRLS